MIKLHGPCLKEGYMMHPKENFEQLTKYWPPLEIYLKMLLVLLDDPLHLHQIEAFQE